MISFRSAVVCGLVHLCSLHAALAGSVSTQQIIKDLKATLSPGSEVVLTSDPAFAQDFTARFSGTHAPQFVVAAKPKLVTDVQKLIKYASRQKVPFLATGGGHGYTWSLGQLQNAIQLDLGNFQTIEVDAAGNTMKVGGAVRIGNVTQELHALGKEFPVGMCPSVGVSGLTLGGGVGPLGGFYGATSDNLISAEVVTGTGKILTASATENADLFYGIRGAGFNFGVVTSLNYRIHPATNQGRVTVVNAMFPANLSTSVWQATNKYVGHHPKELAILFAIRFNETLGGMSFVGSFIYFGPETQALEVIRPFLDLNPLYLEVINDASYSNFSSVALYGDVADIGPKKSIDFAPYTLNLYKVDVKNLVSSLNHMNATLTANPNLRPATLSWAQYSPEGYLKFPLESSAFAYRDVVVWFSYDGFTTDPAQIPALDKFGKDIRGLVQRGSGRRDLETYVHFSHGDEGPAAWYTKGKLPGLRKLKRTYDPESLFSWYNPISGY
ncbi:uncharacterized protein JN550_006860 [Neoarthrinium moseri]|uniref:uncharacterized protein n=1 Tax=Neoarthrinium moseri TaxID=1658444 RepID=UPI001FDBCEF9|nr:uncharacterized protein JN550_006860 [Neoarthrinium moseri]KAI1867719.1 hypothetical protein JN550_006860 [Neoarthrinium moseri]